MIATKFLMRQNVSVSEQSDYDVLRNYEKQLDLRIKDQKTLEKLRQWQADGDLLFEKSDLNQ